jgi:RNA polymerase sigma factor (sigma-70 family)
MDHYKKRIHRYSDEIDNTAENPPEERIIDIEESEKMFNLVARTLPKNEARAVIFKFKDNCDTTEIAKRMGIRSRSVSRYVSVGIKKLRDIIPDRRENNNGGY